MGPLVFSVYQRERERRPLVIQKSFVFNYLLAPPTRVERVTFGLGNRCSIL